MTDNIETENKKSWSPPTLYNLDVKKTMGGGDYANNETADYQPFS